MADSTIDTILRRRSVRKYRPTLVSEDHLAAILEAGRQAPSAANRQPWHFIVVRDEALKHKLSQACSGQMWMADAGVILAGVAKPSVSEKWYAVDVAIAMQNMMLAATALGYGTCWIGAFDPDRVKELLGVPEEMQVVALTPVGAPADSPEARPRQPMSEFVSEGRYGKPLG